MRKLIFSLTRSWTWLPVLRQFFSSGAAADGHTTYKARTSTKLTNNYHVRPRLTDFITFWPWLSRQVLSYRGLKPWWDSTWRLNHGQKVVGVAKLWRVNPLWWGYQSCGEVTQPSVARLPNLWQDYLWRGYLVARLPATITRIHLPQQYCERLAMVLNLTFHRFIGWQSNISLESATFQLYGFSSSFSAILHFYCIGKQ